jgi:hypothetical protein
VQKENFGRSSEFLGKNMVGTESVIHMHCKLIGLKEAQILVP